MYYLLLAIILFSGPAAISQTLTRNAVLLKGQEFERSFIDITNFEITIAGIRQKHVNAHTQVSHIRVEDVFDSAYIINYTVTRRIHEKEAAGKRERVDTDNPADTGYLIDDEELRADIGKINRVVANTPYFTIQTVDTTASQMAITDPIGRGQLFVPKYAFDVYEMVAGLRIGQTRVGQSWTDTLNNGGGHQIRKSTLSAVSGTEAIIDMVTTMTLDSAVGKENQKIIIRLKAEEKTRVIFDPQTCIVKKIESLEESSGTNIVRGVEYPFISKKQKTTVIRPKKD